jgi:hypothetical protein
MGMSGSQGDEGMDRGASRGRGHAGGSEESPRGGDDMGDVEGDETE